MPKRAHDEDETTVHNGEPMNKYDNMTEIYQEHSELPGPSLNQGTEEDINEHDMEVTMGLDAVNIDKLDLAEITNMPQTVGISAPMATIYDQGQ